MTSSAPVSVHRAFAARRTIRPLIKRVGGGVGGIRGSNAVASPLLPRTHVAAFGTESGGNKARHRKKNGMFGGAPMLGALHAPRLPSVAAIR